MQNITMSQMLKVIGITKSTYLKWEEALALNVPRNDKGHREFPAELVEHLQTFGQNLESLEQDAQGLSGLVQGLQLQLPKDAYGVPVLDAYWENYFKTFNKELAEAGIDLAQLLAWEKQLELALPRDQQGNRCLNRDWRRYLQEVKEKMAQGHDAYWITYNIQTPNQVRPQLAHASAYDPEY
ncbi:MAG: hypothetical protein ACAI44_01645 [Candidatus Sericytochromatia bacterium]